MGNPFTTTSVTNYNSNPPSDDGSQTAANRVQWSTQKTKLADPIKTAFDTSETATQTAFGKVIGGGGITTTAVDYTVSASDQGKFVNATAAVTITTPDATVVGSPFVCAVVNDSSGDITLAGNNPGVQQTVDGANTVTIPAGAGVFLNTDGTNWFTAGQNFTKTQIVPQGRLTLVSGSAIMTSDQSAKTAVYFTPYNGDQVPIPNGTKFNVKEFAELTLTLNGTNYLANTLYDVFVALSPSDNSTIIIGTGPAWSTSTAGSGARGTGAGTTECVLLKGLNVNANAITLRNNTTTYSVALKCAIRVGTIMIDGTNGQVSCTPTVGQSRNWAICNDFNRRETALQVRDSTTSWTYSTATFRSSNNAAANFARIVSSSTDDIVGANFLQLAQGGSTGSAQIGIGLNSTSAASGRIGQSNNGSSGPIATDMTASYNGLGLLGANAFNAIEIAGGSVTSTFSGSSNMMMTVKFMA